jgi:hypothetical protein
MVSTLNVAVNKGQLVNRFSTDFRKRSVGRSTSVDVIPVNGGRAGQPSKLYRVLFRTVRGSEEGSSICKPDKGDHRDSSAHSSRVS